MRCATVTNSAATVVKSSGSSSVLSTETTGSAVPLEKIDRRRARERHLEPQAVDRDDQRELESAGTRPNRLRRRVASRQPTPMPRKLASRMKSEK
jgi:hypothetical protein